VRGREKSRNKKQESRLKKLEARKKRIKSRLARHFGIGREEIFEVRSKRLEVTNRKHQTLNAKQKAAYMKSAPKPRSVGGRINSRGIGTKLTNNILPRTQKKRHRNDVFNASRINASQINESPSPYRLVINY
jgi:hypothetical protein